MLMADRDLRAWGALNTIRGLGPKRLSQVATRLEDLHVGAGTLIGADSNRLREIGISERFVGEVREALDAPPPIKLPDSGGSILTPDHDNYPRHRLHEGLALPTLLYVQGDPSLLFRPSIAIAGSRAAPEQALEYATETSRILVANGRVIVSGLAGGIDSAAHSAALQAGGSTIAVLAEGIDAATSKTRSLLAVDDERVLIVSSYAPQDAWTPRRAMARNATIAALADAVVVVASGLRGGSLAQGELCLDRGKRLLVPDFPGEVAPGNQQLIRGGAVPLDPDTPAAVVRLLETEDSAESPIQMDLPV
jgi:DNA processing protein